jgi:hypothetical protein
VSFDLVIFAPAHVPADARKFLSWFEAIAGTEDDFRFPDAQDCVPELRECFEELKGYLPWLEESPDADCATDYSFARYLIHCSFPSSCHAKAYDTTLALCWRMKLGLYALDEGGEVIRPERARDVIDARAAARRPWWKIWRP